MERHITIPRYRALQRHWSRSPRAEWLIAGYLGFKPPPEAVRAARPPGTPPGTAQRPVRAHAKPGALQGLFGSLGGTPGKTVVLQP